MFLLFIFQLHQALLLHISPNLLTNPTTNLLFQFAATTSSTYQSGTQFEIIFDSLFAGKLLDGAYTCSISIWPRSIPSPTCNMASLTLTVSNIFGSSFVGLLYGALTLNGVAKPDFSSTADITFNIIISGSTIATITKQISFYQKLLICSVNAQNTVVLSSTKLIIQITPQTNIPVGGSIKMKYPQEWIATSDSSNVLFGNLVTCSAINPSGFTIASCINNNQKIQILNLNQSLSTTFRYSVQTLNGPPTTGMNGAFQIETYDASNKLLDSGSCSISTTTAASISSISLTSSSTQVNKLCNWLLQIVSITPYKNQDLLKITIPSNFITSQISAIKMNNINMPYWQISSNVYSRIQTNVVISAATNIQFTIQGIINPTAVISSGTLTLAIQRYGSVIQQGIVSLYVLTSSELSGITSNINEQMSSLDSIVILYLIIPLTTDTLQIDINPFAFRSCASINLDVNSPSCSYSNPTLTITGLNINSLSHTITTTLNLLLTNPQAPGNYPFIIRAKQSNNLISTGSLNITINAIQLPYNSFTLSFSTPALQQPSIYIFTVRISIDQPIGKAQLILPSEVDTSILTSCTINNTPSSTCAPSGSVVTVSIDNLISAGSIQIRLSNLNIPDNLKPIITQIKFYKGTSQLYQFSTSPGKSPTTVAVFSTASVTSSDRNMLANTVLTFELQLLSDVTTNPWKLKISGISIFTSCSGSAQVTSIICYFVDDILTLDFRFNSLPFSKSNTFTFSISTVNGVSPINYQISLYHNQYLSYQTTITGESLNTLNSMTLQGHSSSSYYGQTSNIIAFQIISIPQGTTQIEINLDSSFNSNGCQSIQSCTYASKTCSCSGQFYSQVTVFATGISNPASPGVYTFSANAKISSIIVTTATWNYVLSCTLPCQTCLISNPTKCLSCYPTSSSTVTSKHLYQQGNCKTVCSSNYIQSSGTCIQCPSLCLTCSSISVCTSCTTSSFSHQNSCLAICPAGFYSSSNTCVACINVCSKCTSSSNCTQCISTHALHQNSCLSTCPNQYGKSNGQCLNCINNCQVCDPINTCLTCKSNYFLDQGGCYISCITHQLFPNSASGICQACSNPCASCGSSYNDCTSCVVGYLLSGSCISCSVSYFINPASQCQKCQVKCLSCISRKASCTSCAISYSLSAGICVQKCSTGFTSVSAQCIACTSNCLTCTGAITYCTACLPSYLLYNNACQSTCPVQTPALYGINTTCLQCITPCKQCSNSPFFCTSCIQNYYYLSNHCFLSCPDYFYPSGPTCLPCQSPCLLCQSSVSCISCASGKFVYQGSCLNQCPNNLFIQKGICVACSAVCSSCLSRSMDCNECSSNQLLYNKITKQCLSSCQQNYYRVDNQCKICSFPCRMCNQNGGCTECVNGYFLKDSVCSQNCVSGYYSKPGQNFCTACPTTCRQCNYTGCSSCLENYFLYIGECLNNCPSQAPNQDEGICSDCQRISNCLKCNNGVSCSICINPFLVEDGVCVQQCSLNSNKSNGMCIISSQQRYLDLEQSIKDNKSVPFMYLILVFAVYIAVLLQKCFNRFTCIPQLLLPITGLAQTATALHLLIYILQKDTGSNIQLYLIIIIVSVNSILNISSFFLSRFSFYQDVDFKGWQNKHKASSLFIKVLALLINFKICHIMLSKFWNLPIFSAPLRSIDHLKMDNILLILNAILFQIPCIIASSLILAQLKSTITKAIAISAFGLALSYKAIFHRQQKYFYQQWQGVQGSIETIKDSQGRHDPQDDIQIKSTKSTPCQKTQYIFEKHILKRYSSLKDFNSYQDHQKNQTNLIPQLLQKGNFRPGRKLTMQQRLAKLLDNMEKKKKKKHKPKPKKKKKNKKMNANVDRLLYVPKVAQIELKAQKIDTLKNEQYNYLKIPKIIPRGKLNDLKHENYIKFNYEPQKESNRFEASQKDNSYYDIVDKSENTKGFYSVNSRQMRIRPIDW